MSASDFPNDGESKVVIGGRLRDEKEHEGVGEVSMKQENGGMKPKETEYAQSESSVSSHRTFLKKKSTRSSLSPQTSSSSLSSFFKKLNNKRGSPSNTGNDEELLENTRSKTNSIASKLTNSFEDLSTNEIQASAEKDRKEDVSSAKGSCKRSHRKKGAEKEDKAVSGGIESPGRDEDDSHSSKHGPFHHHHNNHHRHLSLRRFLKKIKPSESRSSLGEDRGGHNGLVKSESRSSFKRSSILESKYGVVDRLLGSGASGSVNLLHDKNDPKKLLAVKKFRPRLPNESEHDYKIKVRNEFKVGEYLRHQNLIHTLELIKESKANILADPEYFIVMEYCKYDFFNLVMSGLMETNEVACYFKQIIRGVGYLHQNGLAHRDLKLDNCVVNDVGILKLIDFGSVVQFRKERPNARSHPDCIDDKHILTRARGVVGSDPYLAPEVLEPSNFGYDPRQVDVWSIAIIFCCMSLRRFPWKIPKVSDPSYRSFIGEDESQESNLSKSIAKLDFTDSRHQERSRTGPNRLLGLLPRDSRRLIGSMLKLKSEERYTIDDVLKDDYFLSIECCEIEEGDVPSFKKAKNHMHHLVTEEELEKIKAEKESIKKLKESGLA